MSYRIVVAYRPRVVDASLTDRFTSADAVLIEGPKACGKKFTAEQQAASCVYLDIDDQPALRLVWSRPWCCPVSRPS